MCVCQVRLRSGQKSIFGYRTESECNDCMAGMVALHKKTLKKICFSIENAVSETAAMSRLSPQNWVEGRARHGKRGPRTLIFCVRRMQAATGGQRRPQDSSQKGAEVCKRGSKICASSISFPPRFPVFAPPLSFLPPPACVRDKQ